MFLFRFSSYLILVNNKNQKGYFKDMYSALTKYKLVGNVRTYVNTRQFPSKSELKMQIKKRIKRRKESLWHENNTINKIDEFRILKLIQPTFKESNVHVYLIGKRIPKL